MSLLNTLQILAQLAAIALTAAGWGYWIWRLAGRPSLPRAQDQVLCGVAGLCTSCIFMQDLVYADIRLAWSSWVAAAAGAAGLFGIGRQSGARSGSPGFRLPLAGLRPYILIGAVVFCVQGAGLFHHGPNRYYGKAHGDQINYVLLGQFLMEKPFSTDLVDVGLHPWLVKAIDLKEMRIGQSVMNGYVATVTLTDAKSAYGTTSIFFVALMAVTVLALLRHFGVDRRLAWLGALWAGVLPAITQTQLDGFFSQTCIFFTIPALALCIAASQRHFRFGMLATTLVLGFTLATYSEVFVIGAAFAIALGSVAVGLPIRRRAILIAGCLAGSVLLLAPYCILGFKFLIRQYGIAADPNALAPLVPQSGTWPGWAELFLRIPAENPILARGALLAGFLFLGLAVAGLFSRNAPRMAFLAAIAAVPTAILAVLLSAPVFLKYPFAKLLVTFLPLIVALAVMGVARLQLLARILGGRRAQARGMGFPLKPARILRFAGYAAVILFVAAAVDDTYSMLRSVNANEGVLAAVNSQEAQRTYRELEAHPERQYLLKEQHTVLNAWLCYHGRNAEIYADVDLIGDRGVPWDQFGFRRVPRNLATIWFLTGKGTRPFNNPQGTPEIIVRNPQGIDQAGSLVWYWVGDGMDFELVSFAPEPADYDFSFHIMYGPANPGPDRTVSLHDKQEGTVQPRSFTREAHLKFPVRLKQGSNFFALRVDPPNEWLVHIPGDGRKLMVRVQEVTLASAKPSP